MLCLNFYFKFNCDSVIEKGKKKIHFIFYYIVNVRIFLIRNMNLMLKLTSYPLFAVGKITLHINQL